ncbi:Mitochondrial oxaloacetate carrier protein [Tulasnella sp. JGI-2019a]|nr:Mitochondrial oxaloacetate carrier protein [Tulasnella sp. JGI-2019a]
MVSTTESFIFGGLAGCTAVTVSNPFEVAKVRLQLQGELTKAGEFTKVYKNAGDVLAKTWKHEGIRGVQRGLAPAILLNGSRLGKLRLFGLHPSRTWCLTFMLPPPA